MVHEENGFLEYLELQDGRSSLVTKSELLASVRKAGYSISDRQLTFYVSEGLVPRSVRVGTRAGAYPASVVWLMEWILEARDAGASIDALKELLPVWKFLVRARNDNVLNLGEFEYVARQHVTSYEASLDVPRVVTSVLMRSCCSRCRAKMTVVYKDGTSASFNDSNATVGFAFARTQTDSEEAGSLTSGPQCPQWWGSARITLSVPLNYSTDPTTVILGVKPNDTPPPDPLEGLDHHESAAEAETRM